MMRRVAALNPPPAGISLSPYGQTAEGIGYPGLLSIWYNLRMWRAPSAPDRGSHGEEGSADIETVGTYQIYLNRFYRFLPSRGTIPRVGEIRGYPIYQGPEQSTLGTFLFMTKRTSLPWAFTTVREYVADELKSLGAPPLPSVREDLRKRYQERHDYMTKLQQSLSPAELDAPIYLKGGNGIYDMTTSNDKKAYEIIHPNENFLDPHLPPSAIQFIVIPVVIDYSGHPCGYMKIANDLNNQIDLKVLEGLLQ